MRTLKILGAFLTYPTEDLLQALPECRALLEEEKWLPAESLKALDSFMTWMGSQDLLDAQEEYVDLFDRTPSLSLHLFEHIHGDSRDRGQALADLMGVYKDAGFMIKTEEMPDYLPMFLEYLSTCETPESREHLGEIVNILGVMAGRLKNRVSPYACVLEALIEAAARKPDESAVAKALLVTKGNPRSLEELDAAWEEQMAFDKDCGEQASCADKACGV